MPGLANIPRVFNFKRLFWLLFYVFIFFLLLSNSFRYLDPDLGWHLKVGQDIVREKYVPRLNYYNYTLEGQTWVDHEWLLNTVSYLLYSQAGNVGLNIFFALLALSSFILLHFFALKNIKRRIGLGGSSPGFVFSIIFFLTLGMIAASPHLGVRMQEVALLFLVLLYGLLSGYNHGKNWKILFWLLPLFYLWAASHASFLIGLFILFFWLGVKIMENGLAIYFKNRRIAGYFALDRLLSKKRALIFLGFIFLSIAATLLTPYHFELYGFLSQYANNFYMTHIAEWLPAWYFPIAYWQLIYLAIGLAGLILLITGPGHKKFKIDLWESAIFLLFLGLAFKAKRHFPLFFVSTFYFTIKNYLAVLSASDPAVLASGRQILKNQDSNQNFFDSMPRPITAILALTMILASAMVFLRTNFVSDPFRNFCGDYPCRAVEFLKTKPEFEKLNFFSEYAWGGYMIWTYPERKLFIDGRLPQYPYRGGTFLQEYLDFYNEKKLADKLAGYDIRLILIPAKEKKLKFSFIEKYIFRLNESEENRDKNKLAEYLKDSASWKNIYQDQTSIIYFKP